MTERDVYLVIYRVGKSWLPGTDSPEQPGYRAHADYLNEVDKTNRLIIGGPIADFSQIQLALEAESAARVSALLADDPWLQQEMLHIEKVAKWTLLVDPR